MLTAQVHPRIRGEYSIMSSIALLALGSPPHTRGILLCKLRVVFAEGFTPAYAGNTEVGYKAFLLAGVHPRIRGEY